MDNLKLTMHTMINLLLLICIYGFSFNVSAETSPTTTAATTSDTRHQVIYNRDKDYACVQCHKQSKNTLHGTHGESAIAEIGREVK
ncbi:MAG: cytochrome c nitrite reductase pentaheme subunit, partial [Psychromonas sp.]